MWRAIYFSVNCFCSNCGTARITCACTVLEEVLLLFKPVRSRRMSRHAIISPTICGHQGNLIFADYYSSSKSDIVRPAVTTQSSLGTVFADSWDWPNLKTIPSSSADIFRDSDPQTWRLWAICLDAVYFLLRPNVGVGFLPKKKHHFVLFSL